MKRFISILLNLCVVSFLADATISLLDDTLIVTFGLHALGAIRGIVFCLAIVTAIVVYILMAITPIIPKRFFLPITLFNPVAMLAVIPLFIYHYDRLEQISWFISLCQVIFGLGILYWLQRGFNFRWPLVSDDKLGNRPFGWLHLFRFLLVNVFVLLPGLFLYLALCASLAVDHFSGSFLALRSDGLTVRARKYVRADGKTIQLIPMMHIGDAGFYQQISKSFATNSVILMEGVTDNKNLLQHELSYKRAAKSLGLAEQEEKFVPPAGQWRLADLDVEQFSENTIQFLNVTTLLYSKGLKVEIVLELVQQSQSPLLLEQLQEDLVTKRNQHLLQEIQTELHDSENIVVPWGAAHMPGIAREIQASGFHLAESQEYKVVNFRSVWNGARSKKK